MKNIKTKIKRQEDNGMKILDKLEVDNRTSLLTNQNHSKNLSYKESDSSKSNSTHKKSIYSHYIPNNNEEATLSKVEKKKLNKKSNIDINLDENPKDIYSNTLPNYNSSAKNKKNNSKKIFPRSKTNREVNNNQENSTVECDSSRLYVHKKLKDFNILNINKRNLQTTKNNNKKEIIYEDSFSQNLSNIDQYTKLVVFSNRNKYFKKKHLSEIENISNRISGKMKHMKYLGTPIKKKKSSFFNLSMNDNKNKIFDSCENDLNQNENITNEKRLQDEIDNGYENRLDNLKDYINIYNNYDNSNNENENDNNNDFNLYDKENNISSVEKDKKNIKTNDNNKNKKIFINKNQINNINNGGEKSGDKGDTININKNIIINKKIILLPKEKDKDKNNWSNTTYGFFNAYKNAKNNFYSNYNDNYINKNLKKKKKDNFSHSKKKLSLNNFIYQKKNFAVHNRRTSSKEAAFNKDNNNKNNKSKNKNIMEKLNNNISTEIKEMSNTEQTFYAHKKNKSHYKDNLLNSTFKKNLTERRTMSNIPDISKISDKFSLTKSEVPEDIFYKISNINQNQKIIKVNKNVSKLKDKKRNLNLLNRTTDLSLLEKVEYLEFQLKSIVNKISKYQNCEKECYEFIHFYFEHYFYEDKIKIFYNSKNKELIKNYIKI